MRVIPSPKGTPSTKTAIAGLRIDFHFAHPVMLNAWVFRLSYANPLENIIRRSSLDRSAKNNTSSKPSLNEAA